MRKFDQLIFFLVSIILYLSIAGCTENPSDFHVACISLQNVRPKSNQNAHPDESTSSFAHGPSMIVIKENNFDHRNRDSHSFRTPFNRVVDSNYQYLCGPKAYSVFIPLYEILNECDLPQDWQLKSFSATHNDKRFEWDPEAIWLDRNYSDWDPSITQYPDSDPRSKIVLPYMLNSVKSGFIYLYRRWGTGMDTTPYIVMVLPDYDDLETKLLTCEIELFNSKSMEPQFKELIISITPKTNEELVTDMERRQSDQRFAAIMYSCVGIPLLVIIGVLTF